MVVWGVSVDTTILHTFLSAPACAACTYMVYSKELVIEHDWFDFFTSEVRMRAVMYMPCVNSLVLS